MNASEAKSVLRTYRPGTADAEDPQIAEALALAKSDPELALWLETNSATYDVLRTKFRQIIPPEGLREQIISEQAASRRMVSKRPSLVVLGGVLAILLLGAGAIYWFLPRPGMENTLAYYQQDMVSIALRTYPMDLTTNDPTAIHAYLTQKHAADFTLPPGLQKATLVGCAVEPWQNAKVSLVCFRTGKPLPPGTEADLWLFVIDGASVKGDSATAVPTFAKINRLMTATWTGEGKLYLLGVAGDEPDIKQYL